MTSTTTTTANQESIEKRLWKAADIMRKTIDAAEYKHIALGLIFLKYISDSFEALHTKINESKGDYKYADSEDTDEYRRENVFWVPVNARWTHIQAQAKQPTIGKILDESLEAIERENKTLKGILPKVFSRPNIASSTLGELIDLFSNIALGTDVAKSKDILGKVYEYFLGQFALAEGKKGGQFYTPASIVKLLVEMIEPYKGRVYDPCCGSGGMFVTSEKFIKEHRGNIDKISIYGQESNQTTYRLCRMNLAIRDIDGSQVKWNNEGSFLNNAHSDLKADFILANPPFNDSHWGGKQLENDGRWKYGVPPVGNANFAWIQHFIHHLSPKGVAGFVLSKGSLTSKSSNEDVIRKNIIDAGMVDCIVNLPAKLFLNAQIPACLWFVSNKRHGFNGDRNRTGEILFINANELGHLINKRTREFSEEDISKITNTYHQWRKEDGEYEDLPGFCASVPVKKVKGLDYVLSPGRYVGLAEVEDDFDFEERFAELKAEFEAQLKEETKLNRRILKNLSKVKLEK